MNEELSIWDILEPEDTVSQEEETEDEYINSLLDDLEDDSFQEEEQEETEDLFESLLKENDDYVKLEIQGLGKWLPPSPYKGIASKYSFTQDLIKNESGGNYKAYNPAGGGEGAVGKYQFRWALHKNKIIEYARSKGYNISTKEEFMNSPALQDGFYEEYWVPNEIMPAVRNLKRMFGNVMSDDQLAKLVHFRGAEGAKRYLSGELGDRPEEYNMPISKYIGMQYGGIPKAQAGQISEYNDIFDMENNDVLDNEEKPINFNDNLVSLGKDVYDVVDVVKDVRNGIIRNIAKATSTGIDTANSIFAQKRGTENLQKMFRRIRERPYYGRTQELNDVPIFT